MRCCAVTLHFIRTIKIRCCKTEWTETCKCTNSFLLTCKICCMAFFVEIQLSASKVRPMWRNIDGLRRLTGWTSRKRRSSQLSNLWWNLMRTVAILTCNSCERTLKRPCLWETCPLSTQGSRTTMQTSRWLNRVAFNSLLAHKVRQRWTTPRVISNIREAI